MDVYHTIYVAVTQLFLGSYVMLLIDFRQPIALWRKRWIITIVLVVCANLMGLLFWNFWETYKHVAVFTMTLPYILATLWCSQYRDGRAVFDIFTALFIGCIGTVNASFTKIFLVDNEYFSFVVRVISFLLMFFLLRRFSLTYQKMIHQLDHSWNLLCIIPTTTFLTTLYVYNNLLLAYPIAALVLVYGLLIVCGGAYYLMYLFFDHIQRENEAQNNRKLLELQISVLQRRMETMKMAEEVLRTQRHDLRHYFQTASELVSRGEQKSAIDFLSAAVKRLDNYQTVHWCRPPILDAVFASYFEQAQYQGIKVDAQISLPEQLPVDEGELAIVFANVLENAIHANLELPLEDRKIYCHVIGHPNIMAEITNPFLNAVWFDENGVPLTGAKGHGLGTRSIQCFCQKYGAACHYEAKDGLFTFRIVL